MSCSRVGLEISKRLIGYWRAGGTESCHLAVGAGRRACFLRSPCGVRISSLRHLSNATSGREVTSTITAASARPRSSGQDAGASKGSQEASSSAGRGGENKKESFLYLKFSQPLAARRDLDLFISDIPVRSADAVLTPNFFTCGRWVVRVDDDGAAELMKRVNHDVFGRLSVERISSYDYVKMQSAYKLRINNASVRVQGHSTRMGRPELQYLFEDFGVSYKDIRFLEVNRPVHLQRQRNPQQSPPHTFVGDWIVKFASPELARNAYQQRDGSIVRGHKIVLTHYDI